MFLFLQNELGELVPTQHQLKIDTHFELPGGIYTKRGKMLRAVFFPTVCICRGGGGVGEVCKCLYTYCRCLPYECEGLSYGHKRRTFEYVAQYQSLLPSSQFPYCLCSHYFGVMGLYESV